MDYSNKPRIGVDEAGKGDYFGYLVVAGVYCDLPTAVKLRDLGVKDSKRLSDNVVLELAKKISKICIHDIIRISPEKYNKLYGKFENLNSMLAWGHARVMENILGEVKCEIIISDKFAEEELLKKSLFEKGKKIKLIQQINAETDVVVAAASVLARAEFLKSLRALGRQVGMVLPKGSAHVEETGRMLIEKYGQDVLEGVAKLHFKVTKNIVK